MTDRNKQAQLDKAKADIEAGNCRVAIPSLFDTERVFSYRGLVAARGDNMTLHQRMDEELYANNVEVSQRTLQSLITEFRAVRSSTEQLFEKYDRRPE